MVHGITFFVSGRARRYTEKYCSSDHLTSYLIIDLPLAMFSVNQESIVLVRNRKDRKAKQFDYGSQLADSVGIDRPADTVAE